MKNYRKITCYENSRRVGKLVTFREQVIRYFENCEPTFSGPYENEEAKRIRPQINWV